MKEETYEGSLTKSKLEEILDQYGEVQYDDDGNISGVLPDDPNEVIAIADIYSGTLAQEKISTTDSFVGYYADINDDGTVDGVIFVDLMQEEVNSPWGTKNTEYGSYSWTVLTSGVKSYYVSQESYSGELGTMDVIAPVRGTSGKDRFYVMALEDVNTGTYYCWYDSADDSGMSDYESDTSADFGTGYDNTGTMIDIWKAGKYGTQNAGSSPDIWGLDAVQTGYENGWFVPSIGEWAAYSGQLGITVYNYNSTYRSKVILLVILAEKFGPSLPHLLRCMLY